MTPFSIVFTSRVTRPQTSEGFSVLMSDLINGLINLNIPVQIFTTGRHYDGLINILQKNNVDVDKIKILSLLPDFINIPQLVPSKKAPRFQHLRQRLPKPLNLAVSSFYWLLNEAYIKFKRYIIHHFPDSAHKILTIKGNLILCKSLSEFEKSEQNYQEECQKLAEQLLLNKEADRLFFINAFESDLIANLKEKKIIITFPDLVVSLFPSLYPLTPFNKALNECITKSIQISQGIVCYSEFVRDSQLMKLFSIQNTKPKIAVIPSGFYTVPNDSKAVVTLQKPDFNQYVKNYFPELGPLPKIQFGEFHYILYPTVDRPHKNTRILILAIQELIRKRYLQIKLLLTGDGPIQANAEFIRAHKLHYDIFYLPELPLDVFNHLINQASLVIHPSLAEGGDIFNFSRAVSNNCPALLSDITVAHEMFERHGIPYNQYKDWLFDPFNWENLADLIEKNLAQREALLTVQKKIFNKISGYDFINMAKKYYEFYCSV